MFGKLIFDEETLLNGNIFQYEQRLKSHTNKYIESGAILTTYFQVRDNAVTVDRGTKDIDKIFGHKSPLRFNRILNFPVYNCSSFNPNNTDEIGIEDINVEVEGTILPSTIVPSTMDFLIINHLKMIAVFQVNEVIYDSMKPEGYYKIKYRLYSTSEETLQNLKRQTVETYRTDLNAIGSNINPIIKEDDFIRRGQIQQMVDQMIESYRALFYNERHNCFLFYNQNVGINSSEFSTRWFDLCGNEFIAKHSLMNSPNSTNVIILHEKIRDQFLPVYYNNSIYNWIELGAPKKLMQKFHFMLSHSDGYRDSSFARWSDGDIQIMQPLALYQSGIHKQRFSFFDDAQLQAFERADSNLTSEYENLISKFINNGHSISIADISLDTANALLGSVRHIDVFLYTPILIYIIRKILRMN